MGQREYTFGKKENGQYQFLIGHFVVQSLETENLHGH